MLKQLVVGDDPTSVQETSFSIDVLGRFLCNTWEEATQNGGPAFDVVVIGGGMYGAYCAAKVFRRHPGKRVLLLDAGKFLLPEHMQNLGRTGLEIPSPIDPANDPHVARAHVWGIPWRGNVEFPGLAYCTGGKSLYWGGWCPRLTPGDLLRWPASTALYLAMNYLDVEREIGVVPDTDFITGDLYTTLLARLPAAAAAVPGIETTLGNQGVEPPPLAVQGNAPASGLFSFDKYSSLPLLSDAVRADVGVSGGNDSNRRLFVVPQAHVIKVHTAGGVANAVELDVAGQRASLPVGPHCSVIFAASAVESTRLALHSFPTPLMGRNLMAHVRSDFTVRIRRTALPAFPHTPPGRVETAALLVRGAVPEGRFHIQVTASTSRGGSDELLFRMIPDVDLFEQQMANADPDWLTLTLRCIGEMSGDTVSSVPDTSKSWVNLSPHQRDEFGEPRAYVHFTLSQQDATVWGRMDKAALDLAQGLAGNAASIEYLYDGGWQASPFPLNRPFPEWHRGLGTTYHESGTLWMGDTPQTSVTDSVGPFHHVSNAYACDQSLFPTVGSVNPVLTGLTLTKQLVEHLP